MVVRVLTRPYGRAMSTLPLDSILGTCHGYASEAAKHAEAVLREPWRIAILGRIGVGKTTLFNAMTASTMATGLGGVTTSAHRAPGDNVEWIDTPGIDGRDRALAVLEPIAAQADAIVWVIDALQPATRTERDVMAAICAPNQALSVIIARWDLVSESECASVRERVARLCPNADEVHGCDLRTQAPRLIAMTPASTSPRRRLSVDIAVKAALEAHENLEPPPDASSASALLRDAWSSAVRAAAKPVQTLVDQDTIESAARLTRALRDHQKATWKAASDVPRLTAAFAKHGTPKWPEPPAIAKHRMSRVAAAMGGRHRATSTLKQLAGKWTLAGHLTAAEWVEGATQVRTDRDKWQADVQRLRAWLDAG